MPSSRTAAALVALTLVAAPGLAALDFASRRDLASPVGATGPVSVAVADFYDRDGIPDVAVSYGASDRIVIFRNDGTGALTVADTLVAPSPDPTPSTSNVGEGPSGIVAVDLDGDTVPDIAGVNSVTSRFISYLNRTPLGVGWQAADDAAERGAGFDLAVVNWSHPPDANYDLVIASDSSVRIALGNGDGSFTAVSIFNRADIGNLLDIEAGDLIGPDPISDVLTVDGTNKKLLVWPGDPMYQGSVLTADPDVLILPTMAAGSPVSPFEAVVGGFDAADIHDDILVGTTEGYVLLFPSLAGPPHYGTPVVTDLVGPRVDGTRPATRLTAMALADMDGDGIDDLVVADAGSTIVAEGYNWLSIFSGCQAVPPVFDVDGSTCGKEPVHHAAADLGFPTAGSLAVADFDAVNGPDILLLNTDAGSLTLLRNDGTGRLDASRSFAAGGREARGGAAAELDGDGNVDLVTAISADETIAFLAGDGAGGFLRGVQQPPRAGARPSAVAVASLTDAVDSRADVLAASLTDQVLWPGSGAGTFGSPALAGTGSGAFRVGNVAGSPSPDLVVVRPAVNTATTWRGDGLGGFTRVADFTGIFRYNHHVLGRFLGGSRDDVIAAGAESNDVLAPTGFHVIRHDAATDTHLPSVFIPFESIDPLLAGLEIGLLAVGDVDRNGRLDVVGLSQAGNLLVFLNDGAGFRWDTRQPPVTLVGSPRGFILHDLNADGLLDAAAASAGGVAVAEGLPGGLFAPGVTHATNIDNSALLPADLDGDGLDELVLVGWHTSDVTVLENISPRRLALWAYLEPDGLPGLDPARLSWPDIGPGTVYDLIRGDVALMLQARDTSDAACLVSDTASLSYLDPTPATWQAGEPYGAYYYLVKCEGGGCADPGFGADSSGTPRVTPADCP